MRIVSLYILTLISSIVFAGSGTNIKEYTKAAKIYHKSCANCHGNKGMGDGVSRLRFSNYPDTNLLSRKSRFTSFEDVVNVIKKGGQLSNVSDYMPPFEQFLNDEEINLIAKFVLLLRENTELSGQLLAREHKLAMRSILYEEAQGELNVEKYEQLGQVLFKTQCSLCHHDTSDRAQKMKKVLPVATDGLVSLSNSDRHYINNIIRNGGEFVGKSASMPPWKDQLTTMEIDALVMYILSIQR